VVAAQKVPAQALEALTAAIPYLAPLHLPGAVVVDRTLLKQVEMAVLVGEKPVQEEV
jgi:hypothetical protein